MARQRVRIRDVGALLLVAACALGLDRMGAFERIDHLASEMRMRLAPIEATGGVVFLGIDARALDAVGVWPWPREVHADVARRLAGLGAAEVLLDIDLSAPSNPRSDAALAAALAELGGGVILPAFSQPPGIASAPDAAQGAGHGAGSAAEPLPPPGAAKGALRANLPLPAFREHAWLAAVNVTADPDGRIRRYAFAHDVAGEEVPSAAAFLSGAFGAPDEAFLVNFALDPASVPLHSIADLLDGTMPAAAIEGRSVVVGAHAIELGDNLPVPVHGIVPGPIVHILATETLLQGIALAPLRGLPLWLVVAALGLAAGASPLRHRPAWIAATFGAASASIEAAAFAAQAQASILAPTAMLHATLAGMGLALAARELDLRRWLLGFAQVETRNGHNVLARIIADSSDAIVVVDARGVVMRMSARAHDLFALPPGLAAPVAMEAVLPPALAEAARAAMARPDGAPAADAPREAAFEARGALRHVEFTAVPSQLQRVVRRGAIEAVMICCVTARDVTLARAQQARLDRLARFDVLTGVANRSEFTARLRAALDPPGRTVSVVAIDLDRFGAINASMGRETGDRVLRALADRLGGTGAACVARLGGDTFALLLDGADLAEAQAQAEAVAEAVAAPFLLEGTSVRVGCRIGIAGAEAGTTAASLLDAAELALDEAGILGEGRRVFDPASATRQARARDIERALWTAVENGELALAYQPQIDLGPMTWAGAEALVRWRHPTLGAVPPDEFVGIAESSGFIEHLGRFVLERACLDAMAWPDATSVAVNVSPLQFRRSDVIADVRHALAASGLDPRRLHLEITESIFVAGSNELLWTLDALRDLGPSLALDDFGSGFSSFGYLAKLPLDKIKLDRMFMLGLEEGGPDEAIVRSVAMLARDLGLKLVCEGVETEAQGEALRSLGCDQGQGYLYGRPQPQAEIAALLSSPGRWPARGDGSEVGSRLAG